MLDNWIEQVKGYEANKVDFAINTSKMGFDPTDGKLVIGGGAGVTKLGMTDWAVNQLYGRLEPTVFGSAAPIPEADMQKRARKSWREYMEVCPNDLRALNLSHWLSEANQDWLVRSYKENARAILTKRYAVVDALECLEWTKAALDDHAPDLAVSFRNVWVSPDALRLSVVMKDIQTPGGGKTRHAGDNWAIGADIGTGEIGNYRLWCNPFIQRHSCENSIVVDTEASFNHRHVGIGEFLKRQLAVAIFDAVKGCEEVLRKVLASLEEPLPRMDDIISDMVKRNNWKEDVGIAIACGTEGEHNLWGLVNGISFAANGAGDENARLQLHRMAGSVLVGKANLPYDEE